MITVPLVPGVAGTLDLKVEGTRAPSIPAGDGTLACSGIVMKAGERAICRS